MLCGINSVLTLHEVLINPVLRCMLRGINSVLTLHEVLINSAMCVLLCTGCKTVVAAPEARIAAITITEKIVADEAMIVV